MNALTRWDPFKEMEELQKRLTSIFSLAPQRPTNGREENMTVAQWLPLVDIAEDDKEYSIKVELPEVKKEDVKVTRSEEHTSELQSRLHLVCRLLLEKKKKKNIK